MELLSIRAIAAIVAGMVFTIVLIAMLKAPAQRFDLVDVPGGRKNHARAIPLVGGLAMFVAFCIAFLIVPTTLRPYASLVVGMGLMTATGLVDDTMQFRQSEEFVAVIRSIFCEGAIPLYQSVFIGPE